MTKFFCIAVLMSLCAWSFAVPGFTTHRETRNLIGPRRLPNKKLSAGQVALKNVIAKAEGDWEAYTETLSPELVEEWQTNNAVPSGSGKRRGRALKITQLPRIISTKKQSGSVIVVVEERIQNLTNRYTMTLEKKPSGWLIVSKEEESSSSIVRK